MNLREQLAFDVREYHVPYAQWAAQRGKPEALGAMLKLITNLKADEPVLVTGSILAGALMRLRDDHAVIRVQRPPGDAPFVVHPDGSYTPA